MARDCLSFWLPRRGYQPEEYEDASAADPVTGRFALSDGTTNSSFANLWAQLLVADFVQNVDHNLTRLDAFFFAIQKQWYTSPIIQETLEKIARNPLRFWFIKDKLMKGGFATFLGLSITSAPGEIPQWEATAVGDTCLFHTRGPTLFSAFPIDHSSKFNNSPKLLGSRTPPDRIRKTPALRIQGSGLTDDRLWMMTDALAKWCLMEHEGGRDPWGEIDSILTCPEPQQRFSAWIEEIRSSRKLHNDDVTLLLIIL